MTPAHCSHPACGRWTYADYCSDECRGFTATNAAKGIGMVTPPHKVRVTAIKRVRRNEGYVAKGNKAWHATAEAPYLEFERDCRTRARKVSTSRDTGTTAKSPAHKASLISRMSPSNGGNPDA